MKYSMIQSNVLIIMCMHVCLGFRICSSSSVSEKRNMVDREWSLEPQSYGLSDHSNCSFSAPYMYMYMHVYPCMIQSQMMLVLVHKRVRHFSSLFDMKRPIILTNCEAQSLRERFVLRRQCSRDSVFC